MSEEVDKKHWADREERGSFLLMKFTAFAAKVLGRRLLSPLLYGIVLYFSSSAGSPGAVPGSTSSGWPSGAGATICARVTGGCLASS